MNKKIKLILIVVGISGLIGNTVSLYITWMKAFFSGGKVVVAINNWNEMWLEFFMLPILMVIGFWAIYQLVFKVKLVRRNPQ